MAFPEDALDLRAEIQIAGVWTDITSRLKATDPLVASYGMSAEGSRVDPSTCTLRLDNSDGALSPRNPLSPWFGQLGRNTPVRVTVPSGESYLLLDGSPTGIASTPDTAALDIVGDLDLRVEVVGDLYSGPITRNLIGKLDASGGPTYLLQLSTVGTLRLRWATGPAVYASYTLPLPPGGLPRRVALRAALDVDDGAGGWLVRMYWAPSLAGPWERFGAEFAPGVGTSSVYPSNEPLLIAPSTPTSATPGVPFEGRIFGAEVRNSSGTLVAAPDFSAQAPGTTSFADSTGKTWALAGSASIWDREYLFYGEMAKSPPRWVPSGRQVWVPAEAAGVLRRLGQGRKPVDSTLRRKIPSTPGVLAYWPMEDDRAATQAYSPIPGVAPMRVTGLTFAAVDTLVSSEPLPTLKAPSSLNGSVPAPKTGSLEWTVSWLYRLDAVPAVERTYMGLTGSGTVRRWAFTFAASVSRIVGYGADGDEVVNQPVATSGDLFNQWVQTTFKVRQVGGSVEWRIDWRDVGGDAGGYGATFSGTAGRCTGVISPSAGFHSDLDGMSLGHVGVFSTYDTTAYTGAVTGYAGETALNRMLRLASEESGLPLTWTDGDATRDSALMGPQRPAVLMDLVQEAADADGGILIEDPTRLGLLYRDRTSLYNQTPALVLDYTAKQVAPPLEPVDDDKWTRNDITVTRIGGSAARVTVTDGPLSVLPPEEGGVGLYDEAVTLNLANDDQPIQIAGWKAHLGTWDEARYPSVRVRLDQVPHLIPAVLGMRVGDNLRIINTPHFVQPGPIDLQVRKITHTPKPRTWEVVFECLPAGPWSVGVLEHPELSRADTAGSALASSAGTGDTLLTVATTNGPRWVDASLLWEFPFGVRVGGEVVRVEQITGQVQDVFARTVATGWGTATSGQAWTTSGGSTADYSVQGA